MIKKIILVFIFIGFTPLFAQIFSEVDFERLILNHPMMKNYDPKTGHFKNTPHELRAVSDLKAENASMSLELEEIKKKELKNSSISFSDDDIDEEALWGDISSLTKRKKELENKIRKNEDLIQSGGDPGYEKLYPIIDDICNDIFVPLYNKDKVILNKLPRYAANMLQLEGNDMHNFWFYQNNEEVLQKYLEYSGIIALMFPNMDKTILFQKTVGDK